VVPEHPLTCGHLPPKVIPDPPPAVELWRVRAPLVRVHRSHHGSQAVRESILVGWHDRSGVVGWAECPTLATSGYATETVEESWAALVSALVPAALGGRSPGLVVAPAASASLLDAATDALLREGGVSLASHLGALQDCSSRPAVPWCAVLADVDSSADELIEAAAEALAGGASMLKVKVSGAQRERLGALVSSVEVPVAADANGSLDPAGVAALDDLGLAYLEQPLAATLTWEQWASLREAMATPLALDESLPSLDAVRCALLAGALDVVSVKPARMGGCAAAATAAAMAARQGVSCFVGGMFELGIGRAAALAVASLGVCDLPCDLGPSGRYVEPDVCEPLVSGANGDVLVPDGSGIGRVPEPRRLDVVDHHLLEA
jgi:O-succinylbenzoate synthase